MDEPTWRKIGLSLERPYVDEDGKTFPTLLDITPDGEHIYEPRKDTATRLGEKFNRIFTERGIDFFDHIVDCAGYTHNGGDIEMGDAKDSVKEVDLELSKSTAQQHMTHETLFEMRTEIIPQLHVAMGEISHAHDLLSLLLSSSVRNESSSSQNVSPVSLTSSTVSKLVDLSSVQAFSSQLVLGGKDTILRKASDILKNAAEKTHAGLERDEKYWLNSLQIRKRNWGLVPAPLPLGSVTGKEEDKLSKDFLISFGLENSPAHWLRNAIGHLQHQAGTSSDASVFFPSRQRFRLRVSITNYGLNNPDSFFQNNNTRRQHNNLDDHIRSAQQEIVEKEIFSELIRLAGNVITAPVRVSERLIKIEAAQGMDLKFEMVEEQFFDSDTSLSNSTKENYICDLIYAALHILLIRTHAQTKSRRLKSNNEAHFTNPALLLQPIIDLLQYQAFCARIHQEFLRMVQALQRAAFPAHLRFEPVGDCGEHLLKYLVDEQKYRITGEAVLRIEKRQTLRFTFVSPSSLTAHVPQATVSITSVPQLSQLLIDEVERALLKWICDIGAEMCQNLNGTWFVDHMMYRTVGRWEGCTLNFRVACSSDFSLTCTAYLFERDEKRSSHKILVYDQQLQQGLLSWIKSIVDTALSQ